MEIFNIHEIASEIKSHFSEKDKGDLIAKLTIAKDPIDGMQIWRYSVCLNINGINKREYCLFEVGDGIGSQDRHKHHMQMTIDLTDYLSKVIEGYLSIIKCEVSKSIAMDEPIDNLSIPFSFVHDE